MPSLTVVTKNPEHLDKVYFGAWVTLENDVGDELIYRIVGADEIGSKRNYISLDSPLAKALLKKSVDDRVIMTVAEKQFCAFIVNIHYEN